MAECILAVVESTEVHIGTVAVIAEACFGAVAESAMVGVGAVVNEVGACG